LALYDWGLALYAWGLALYDCGLALYAWGLALYDCGLPFQVAEEECGSAAANDMATEPYFVDFMRDAPEITGNCCLTLSDTPSHGSRQNMSVN